MIVFSEYWYVFFIPGLLIGLYAQMKLRSTYSRFIQVPASTGLSGAEAAREILDRSGLHNVPVQEVRGHLTDHYDPTRKALFLSSANFRGRSLAALGVAAHEAGHALQDQAAYGPLKLRMALVPATAFASNAAVWITMIGLFAGIHSILGIAIGIYAIITLFQLITLPVEYDASRRAKRTLLNLGLITGQEQGAVGRVLNAAALTYVAALVAAVLQLLHLIMIARGDD